MQILALSQRAPGVTAADVVLLVDGGRHLTPSLR